MKPQDEFEEAIAGKIPARMVMGLSRYIWDGIEPGGFMTCVLENDLRGAVLAADDENIHRLRDYIKTMWAYCPVGSWGSRENVRDWMRRGGLRSIAAKEKEGVE